MTFNVQKLKNQNPIISKMANHEEIFGKTQTISPIPRFLLQLMILKMRKQD